MAICMMLSHQDERKCHGMRVKVRLWIICYCCWAWTEHMFVFCSFFKSKSNSSLECVERRSHCSSVFNSAVVGIRAPIIDSLVVWPFAVNTHWQKRAKSFDTNYWTAQYRFSASLNEWSIWSSVLSFPRTTHSTLIERRKLTHSDHVCLQFHWENNCCGGWCIVCTSQAVSPIYR